MSTETAIPEEMRTRCQVFSRIVGYYRPTSEWNEGKKSEFNDRKVFKLGQVSSNGK